MADAYILSLEVDDNGSVVIKNFKKNVEDAGGAAEKGGKQASGPGAEGFHLFGMAAAKAGDQLGLPFRAPNMLGTQVEKLTKAAFPAWGMALGVAGGAAMVAAGVTMYLIKRKEDLVEATKKNVDALRGEVDALYVHTPQTYAAEKATKAYLEAKREVLKFELVKMIRDETEKIEEQEDKLKKLNAQFSEKDSYTQNELIAMGRRQEQIRVLTADIGALTAKRKADQIYLESLNKNISYANFSGWEEGAAARTKREQDMGLARIAREDAINAAILESARRKATDQFTIQAIEQEQFDQATQAKLHTIESYEAREDYRRQRTIEREGLLVQQKRQIDQRGLSNQAQIYGASSQLLDQTYKLGHEKYKAFFYASRAAAAAESIIQGHLGASKAVGTFWGMEMAPVLIGMGYANAAMILGQTFLGGGGGGGGGGGAIGTYSANSVTGQPTPAYQIYYEQDPKNPRSGGTGWRPGEGQNNGPTYILQNSTIIAQDSDSFERMVVKASAKNYKDQGELHEAING